MNVGFLCGFRIEREICNLFILNILGMYICAQSYTHARLIYSTVDLLLLEFDIGVERGESTYVL